MYAKILAIALVLLLTAAQGEARTFTDSAGRKAWW